MCELSSASTNLRTFRKCIPYSTPAYSAISSLNGVPFELSIQRCEEHFRCSVQSVPGRNTKRKALCSLMIW